MSKYLLFAWNSGNPRGGARDFLSGFDSLVDVAEEVKIAGKMFGYDAFDVIEISSNPDAIEKNFRQCSMKNLREEEAKQGRTPHIGTATARIELKVTDVDEGLKKAIREIVLEILRELE